MFNQVNNKVCRSDFKSMLSLSEDGYIRMTQEALLPIPLMHLFSGIDLDNRDNFQAGASLTHISGYTEWVSTTTPTITLGWDWWLDTQLGRLVFKRIDPPRSNLMLVDDVGHDLGNMKTSILLEGIIDRYKWQEKISEYIALKYI